MQALSARDTFLFEGFRLERRGLLREEKNALAPVEIGSRALDVLRALLARPDDLVSRDEIMAAAWPGMVVDYNNLNVQISALRRLLDQDRANGSCIQTVPGRGYRFLGSVRRVDTAHSLAGNGGIASISGNEQARGRGAWCGAGFGAASWLPLSAL